MCSGLLPRHSLQLAVRVPALAGMTGPAAGALAGTATGVLVHVVALGWRAATDSAAAAVAVLEVVVDRGLLEVQTTAFGSSTGTYEVSVTPRRAT